MKDVLQAGQLPFRGTRIGTQAANTLNRTLLATIVLLAFLQIIRAKLMIYLT